MVTAVSEFLGIIGLDLTVPETMAELIPYFLRVCVGIGLIVAIFGFVRYMVTTIISGGRKF